MNNKTHKITWKSSITDDGGEFGPTSKSEADRLCELYNKKFPNINHLVVKIGSN